MAFEEISQFVNKTEFSLKMSDTNSWNGYSWLEWLALPYSTVYNITEKEYIFEPSNKLRVNLQRIQNCDENVFDLKSVIDHTRVATELLFKLEVIQKSTSIAQWDNSLENNVDRIKMFGRKSELSLPLLSITDPLETFVKPILFRDLWKNVNKLQNMTEKIPKSNCPNISDELLQIAVTVLSEINSTIQSTNEIIKFNWTQYVEEIYEMVQISDSAMKNYSNTITQIENSAFWKVNYSTRAKAIADITSSNILVGITPFITEVSNLNLLKASLNQYMKRDGTFNTSTPFLGGLWCR